MGDSVLKDFVEYPYGNLSPSQVVGDKYFSLGKKTVANASAHIWADGFANFGYSGVLTVTLIGVLLLWITDSLFYHYDPIISVVCFSMVAMSFAAQGLQTSMLTGGMVPFLVIGFLAKDALDYNK